MISTSVCGNQSLQTLALMNVIIIRWHLKLKTPQEKGTWPPLFAAFFDSRKSRKRYYNTIIHCGSMTRQLSCIPHISTECRPNLFLDLSAW